MSCSLVAQSGAKPIGGGIRGLPEARPPGSGGNPSGRFLGASLRPDPLSPGCV